MAGRPAALLFQYRLLMALVFPLLAAHAAWLAIRHRNLRFWRERMGLASGETTELWIHAASVGEVNAVIPLVQALAVRRPRSRLLLTTATLSGAATVAAKLPQVRHRFLPIDRTGGVRRLLATAKPRCAVIVETELWPNLYAACQAQAVPIVIVNGRISERTLGAPVWVRDLYEECLTGVRAVLARSAEDRRRFVALGAPGESVEIMGNLKFAAAPRPDAITPMNLGRPYVLAASTRDDEERLVVQAWERASDGTHVLVIAPRHPQRLPAILAELAGRDVAVRSRGEAVSARTAVYVADTFGELPSFMAGADLVFMGGSLVPKGGQNLLEPAALGKAILTGPHTENFSAETEAMLAEHALMQVRDVAELEGGFRALLGDETLRCRLGDSARRLVDARRDVAERYADAVERLCDSAP